jgi:hypothetical protein
VIVRTMRANTCSSLSDEKSSGTFGEATNVWSWWQKSSSRVAPLGEITRVCRNENVIHSGWVCGGGITKIASMEANLALDELSITRNERFDGPRRD